MCGLSQRALWVGKMEKAKDLTLYRLLGQNHNTGEVYFMLNGELWCACRERFEALAGEIVQDAWATGMMHRARLHKREQAEANLERMWQAGSDGA